jgi:hypothetical protein
MRIKRSIACYIRRVADFWYAAPRRRHVDPGTERGAIVSFYMTNVPRRVVEAQRQVLEWLAPPDVAIVQILTPLMHGPAMSRFMRSTNYRCVLFLDIDCVPVRPGAVDALLAHAERGVLAGAAARANHISNGGHVFVGPFCLALTTDTYTALGRPSFSANERGDVGEELTYAAEKLGVPVALSLPVSFDEPRWVLTENVWFGPNTTYENGFLHAFEIRKLANQERFIAKCREILVGRGRVPGTA